MNQLINQSVEVNAFYFAQGRELKTFPRQIEYGGRAVTFVGGLRCLVQREGRLSCLFNMNAADGSSYRLRQEGNQWTLMSRA
ncbi:MAG TPA: hypothetical protein VGS41_01475 [Chthonomonadales bacterium]|nr:hypothetical protein [Chthonomonadales bacterium]